MSAFKVSQDFKEQFEKVCAFYDCEPDEVEEMKGVVRRDYEGAQVSFAAMAQEIDAEIMADAAGNYDGARIERSVKHVERGFKVGA